MLGVVKQDHIPHNILWPASPKTVPWLAWGMRVFLKRSLTRQPTLAALAVGEA